MALFNYSKFKVRIDPQSKKAQGLQAGDIVRRQYKDGNNIIYSLMVVLEAGIDILHDQNNNEQKSPYFIGALIEGDEPKSGELLDFVRVTNLFNSDRSGAMYLTASDNDSPYMDVIDGMAYDNSLCYPFMGAGEPDIPSINKYACTGSSYLSSEYFKSNKDSYRVFRITRNETPNAENETIGFKQTLEKELQNPEMVVVSYKVRASKPVNGVDVSLGYVDGTEIDGKDTINISTDWEYRLSLITVEFPKQYTRSLLIDLTSHLSKGDWCEISDLNIVLLSDIANFSKSTKSRIGKIKGIIDPIFGSIEGYGAYFQKLYATKDVNISGTLTAGDENGFASTFYVGKIHKNCLINSLYGNFSTSVETSIEELSPTGVGNVFVLPIGKSVLVCQKNDWITKHNRQKYCFSFWAKSSDVTNITITQNGNEKLQDVAIDTVNEWVRYNIPFITKSNKGADFTIEITSVAQILFTSPQLEAGDKASLYQATDSNLDETDAYGAWFSRGGIGGTIQNPLLRLNPDGSISSNNGSFVINRDGSGYFAGGAITWNEKEVLLQENVILKWDNLDKQTQENLKGESAYSVNGSLTNYTFQANSLGIITSNQSATTKIYAYKGNENVDFSIGEIPSVSGLSITKNDSLKTITFSVAEGTESLADNGNIEIPVSIDSISFIIPFAWSKAKAGASGDDTESLDWIKDWNNGKTQIGANSVITPKIFTGAKNENGTITGTAIGHFDLNSINASGDVVVETIDGIYGFKDGLRTFSIDNTGSIQLGRDNQFIKYNAKTGKVEFGSEVTLNWTEAINTAKTETISSAATTAQQKADAAKNEAINTSATDATNKADQAKKDAISEATTNTTNLINAIKPSIEEAKKAGTDAQKVADTITNKANNEGWSTKLTFIDKSGIFTGTLSANVVNGIHINASQITSGTIDAARINVEALKSSLITAGNIEALTLNVVRGTIGGWSIDSDAIYRGAKNNTSGTYTSGSGAVTIGSYGIRGFKWRLDSLGGGALAGGNISWDASGNVSFGSSVVLNWTTPINSIVTALGGSSYPKLTKIDANGIYTGTLTAAQVNAVAINASSITTGALSADRIAANSLNGNKITARTISADRIIAGAVTANEIAANTITAAKIASRTITADRIATGVITASEINVGSVRASVLTADAVNALTCNFVRGRIGGFTIGSDNMSVGSIGAVGATPLQIRSTATGSGYWYNGSYKPLGLSLLWHQNANAGHIVFGQVATNGSTVKTGFIGIQMLAWDNTEYFCLSANYTKSGSKEVYNRIAGWAFDNTRIWKNNVSLGSDGAIYNGEKWRLNNDGSGKIANGNISWNAAGAVTFSSAVTLNWTNAATNALNSAKSYADTKKNEAINSAATTAQQKADAAKNAAISSASTDATNKVNAIQVGGTNLVRNSSLIQNQNSWSGGTRVTDMALDGRHSFRSIESGLTANAWRGFLQQYRVDVKAGDKFTASIYTRSDNINSLDNGAAMEIRYYNSSNARITQSSVSIKPTANNTWQRFTVSGTCPSGTVFVEFVAYVTKNGRLWYNGMKLERGNKMTDWSPAPGDVEARITRIDANGIYTGTITASQINAGTISADRIATNSLHGNRITARTISADRIVTGAITANEIAGNTITASKIASRTITADRIATGVITANEIAGGTITAAKIASRTITADRIASGTITANEINVGSIRTSVLTADAVNGLTCNFVRGKIGGFTLNDHAMYSTNVTAGHTIGIQNNGYMYNCNSSSNVDYWALNTDGSALFGTNKIRFNADGSGWLANKNITWDAAGNTTFNGYISGGQFTSLNARTGKGSIGLNGSGITINGDQFWVYGDMYSQGTTNGRTNRYYSGHIFCRGMIGIRGLATMVVYGTYARIYWNGYNESNSNYLQINLTRATSGSVVYYKIPLYGSTDNAAGLPINVVVFKITTSYSYVFSDMGYMHPIIGFNANRSPSVTAFSYRNGVKRGWDPGETSMWLYTGSSIMSPNPSGKLGSGWVMINTSNVNEF